MGFIEVLLARIELIGYDIIMEITLIQALSSYSVLVLLMPLITVMIHVLYLLNWWNEYDLQHQHA